jgi:hypothetical protein
MAAARRDTSSTTPVSFDRRRTFRFEALCGLLTSRPGRSPAPPNLPPKLFVVRLKCTLRPTSYRSSKPSYEALCGQPTEEPHTLLRGSVAGSPLPAPGSTPAPPILPPKLSVASFQYTLHDQCGKLPTIPRLPLTSSRLPVRARPKPTNRPIRK